MKKCSSFKTRVLSIVLSIMMVFGMIPSTVFADSISVNDNNVPECNITYTLENISKGNSPNKVTSGSALSAKLVANTGYTLPNNISVTVSGSAITSNSFTYDKTTGDINIPVVQQDVNIEAKAVLLGALQGEGTEDSPYLISSKEDLISLSEGINNERIVTNVKTYINQTEDIDLSGVDWIPIGTLQNPFMGYYDGGGFSITNLSISSRKQYVGLFGYVGFAGKGSKRKDKYAEILGVNLINPKVVSTNTYEDAFVGALVGYVKYGDLINNSVQGGKVVQEGSSKSYTGGIVGCFYTNNERKFDSCFSTANIKSGDGYAGGLIGSGERGSGESISNCYSTGDIEGEGIVGGIIGYFRRPLKLENVYASGIVKSTGKNCVGGLVGFAEGQISNSVSLNQSVENKDIDKNGRLAGKGQSFSNNRAANITYLNGALVSGKIDDKNGQNTSLTEIKKKATWENMGFDFVDKWEWNDTDCYPKLAGMDGQTENPYDFIPIPLELKRYPTNVSLFIGERATFSVFAVGDADTLVYEWQIRSGETGDWTSISESNSNSNTYTIVADDSNINNYYRCVITDKTGSLETNAVKMKKAFNGGEGTKESPYVIKSDEDLWLLAQYTNGLDKTKKNFAGKYFIQECDIDLSTTEENPWPTIGNRWNSFKATEYDGNGHKISGLVLSGYYDLCCGLFGRIDGVTIKNLQLDSPVINVQNRCVGALVGFAKNTNISGCSVTNAILKGKGVTSNIGGIVGTYEINKNGTYSIEKCYVDARISSINGSVGEIIGICSNSVNGCSLNIKDCYSTGSVVTANNYAGGIIGSTDGKEINVQNCYSTVIISGQKYVGGLVGSLDDNSVIKNSVAANKLINSPIGKLDNDYAGRIAGVGNLIEQNYALSSMLISGELITEGIVNDKNGTDKSSEELKTITTWNELGFDMTNVWEWDESQFPKLRGIPSPSDNPLDENPMEICILKILKQPVRKIVSVGDIVEFKVEAIGTELTYQWQISEKCGAWKNIDKANKSTYELSNTTVNMDGNRFRCVIKDYFDNSVTTNKVLLTFEDKYDNADEASSLYNYYKGSKGKNGILNSIKEPIAVYSYAESLDEFNIEIKYNGGYVGKPNERVFEAPGEGIAALDWMAQGKSPLEYPANISSDDQEIADIDLIETILNMQDPLTGEIKGSNYIDKDSSHIVQMMALEAFFDGESWANQSDNTKLGRSSAIDYLIENLTVDKNSSGLYYRRLINGGKYSSNYLKIQCKLVMLLSRLTKDEVYGTKAFEKMNGVLKTLSFAYETEGKHLLDVDYLAEYISALVAANSVLEEQSDIDQNLNSIYEMFDLLRYAKTEKGKYSQYLNYNNIPDNYDRKSTLEVMTAFGDFKNSRSIYATITDRSGVSLSAEKVVTRDLNKLYIPEMSKENIKLPIKGNNGSCITWKSNNVEAVTTEGKVTRLSQDVTVTLTATATYDSCSASKEFKVLVPLFRDPDLDCVLEDLEALNLFSELINDIELPLVGDHGSTMSWTSDNENVISNEGKVTRPDVGEEDINVNLTLTIQKGKILQTKIFEILVYAKKDSVSEGYYSAREYFLNNRNLSSSYWEVMAAYSVLGDYVTVENGYNFYDLTKHKEFDPWYGTDYGAAVMQLIIMGENPYNYKGKNYVEGLLSSTGAWGAPIWKTMAIQAIGEDYMKYGAMSYCKSELKDFEFGPDLAAWAMIPIATYLEDNPDDEEYKTAILGMVDKFNNGTLNGNDISVGCVSSGFMAMVGAGYDEFDIRKPEMKLNGENIVDRLYNNTFKNGASLSEYGMQIAIEFGDIYCGDSVWRRLAITKQDFSNAILQAENIDTTKYTSDSIDILTNALNVAKELNDTSTFSNAYFTLKDAMKNLVERGKANIKILGNIENPIIVEATDITDILPETAIEEVLTDVLEKLETEYKIESGSIKSIAGLNATENTCWYLYMNGLVSYLSDEISEGDEIVLKYCTDKSSLTEKFDDNLNLDKHIVYDDAESLSIDADLTAVSGNLVLKSNGVFGSNISWSSSNESIIKPDGTVNRLNNSSQVKLTANVKSGIEISTKEYTVIVLGKTAGDPTVRNIKVIFALYGDSHHGEDICHVFKENPSAFEVWVSKREVEMPLGATVKDVFEKILNKEGISYRYKGPNYIAEIKGLAEFDNGNNSGWMYLINGHHAEIGLNQYTLSDGDKIIWHCTDDFSREEGSEKWNNTEMTTDLTSPVVSVVEGKKVVQISTQTEASVDNKGKATAKLTEKQLTEAITNVVEAAKKEGKNTKTLLDINIKGDLRAKQLEVELPVKALKKAEKNIDEIKISSEITQIILNKETLKSILEQSKSSKISISVAKVEKEALNEVAKAIVGDRPVFDFNVLSGNKKITEFDGNEIQLVIPYTINENEDAQKIVIYYIDDNGNIQTIRDCKYDSKTKTVKFATKHLSCYAIGYEKFDDIANHWAEQAIKYAYGKGMFSGTSEDKFSPSKSMTRGMFVTVLGRLAGAGTEYSSTGFSDVLQSDYYAPYIRWAVDNKLVKGKSSNAFEPNQAITREEMAVILANYVEMLGKDITLEGKEFADEKEISIWAKDSVKLIQALGLIQGKEGNKFDPKSTATRAEVAVIFERFMIK